MTALAIVDALEPGSEHAVVGRPGSGVSTTLAAVCAAAADRGLAAVLASWERPPRNWSGILDHPDVLVPEIMNWDLDELARCREVHSLPEGAVVAIDYIQLIDHAGDDNDRMRATCAMATERRWRAVVGVMAPGTPASLPSGRPFGSLAADLPHIVDRADSVPIL